MCLSDLAFECCGSGLCSVCNVYACTSRFPSTPCTNACRVHVTRGLTDCADREVLQSVRTGMLSHGMRVILGTARDSQYGLQGLQVQVPRQRQSWTCLVTQLLLCPASVPACSSSKRCSAVLHAACACGAWAMPRLQHFCWVQCCVRALLFTPQLLRARHTESRQQSSAGSLGSRGGPAGCAAAAAGICWALVRSVCVCVVIRIRTVWLVIFIVVQYLTQTALCCGGLSVWLLHMHAPCIAVQWVHWRQHLSVCAVYSSVQR